MGGLLNKLLGLFAILCVSFALSLGIIAAYAWSKGLLTKPKVLAMLAAAHAESPAQTEAAEKEGRVARQPSFEEIERARALRFRDLELREQALAAGVARVDYEQKKLMEEKETYRLIREAFQKHVENEQQGAVAQGRARVREIWEQMKPKQAKEQILQMVKAGEEQEVVAILSDMTVAKRAKICAEFSKTEEEIEQLDEILRLIRQGMPRAESLEETGAKLQQFDPQG